MHRPERWGYVQFSDETPPARPPIRHDPAGPIRDRLMKIFQAQRAYREKNKSWATNLEALGLANDPPLPEAGPATVKATPDGFEGEITLLARVGRPRQIWTVRQDSRLTVKAQP